MLIYAAWGLLVSRNIRYRALVASLNSYTTAAKCGPRDRVNGHRRSATLARFQGTQPRPKRAPEPEPVLMSLANQVLAVNDDLPIRTDAPVHSGKVRSVYWLSDADSARLSWDAASTRC